MDKPKCPYCGEIMTLCVDAYSDGTITGAYYECIDCKSNSPYIEDADDFQAAALAAATLRWVEPNRVLTLEEVESWGNKETLPIWLEFRYMGGTTQLVASLYGGMSADGIHLYDQVWRAHPMGGYGKRFRIWSVRPTDEEREAAGWEE